MPLLDIITQLTPESGNLLFSEKVENTIVQVRQYDNLRWLHFGNVSMQSLMLLDAPERLILPYTSAMMGCFLFCQNPVNLLNLGFGGGSFERFLGKLRPDLQITSVEKSKLIIRLAKRFFLIPESYQVHHSTSESFLKNKQKLYSIILCDIFNTSGHPSCMSEESFYADIYHNLTDDGVFVANCLISSEKELLTTLIPLRKSFRWVSFYDMEKSKNVLLFATKNKPLDTSSLQKKAQELSRSMKLDLLDIPDNLTLLPQSLVC